MRVIGSKTYKTAKVATSIKVVQCIAATSKIHLSMAEERSYSKTGINIKDNTTRASHMDMESIHGQTEMFTLATLHMVHAWAKEH